MKSFRVDFVGESKIFIVSDMYNTDLLMKDLEDGKLYPHLTPLRGYLINTTHPCAKEVFELVQLATMDGTYKP